MQNRPVAQHDFITIRDAFNRWRAENAPHLSRDEAIRYALGEWLVLRGYLPPQAVDTAERGNAAPSDPVRV